jgi:hypothetical protein
MCNLYQLTPKGSAERAVGLAGLRLVGDDWQPPSHSRALFSLAPSSCRVVRATYALWLVSGE